MYKNFFKRFIDILIAVIGLPLLLIIYIFIAPMIKRIDNGPVFYNAYRIGKDGKLFKMFKFRTMIVNAPDIRLPDGSTYNGVDDPRVTKIGRLLRMSSIDEVPQILNVLLGDMSIIGPRPDPPDTLELYPEEIKVYLSVRPGITGYGQAYFRNSVDGKQKMKNDGYYALNYSFLLDMKILFKTITVITKRDSIYRPSASKVFMNNSSEYMKGFEEVAAEQTSEKINLH